MHSHHDSPSDYEDDHEEANEADSKPFKRIRLSAPLYISDDNAAAAPVFNNIHEEYDDDDEEEEMPKFRYESKFKASNLSAANEKLYTEEERRIFNDMLFNEYVDFEEPSSAMKYDEPPMEPNLDFVSAEDSLESDLPLVTPLELASEEKRTMLPMPSRRSSESRWPMTQDNSTSFSILNKQQLQQKQSKPKSELTPAVKAEEISTTEDVDALFEQEDSLDSFLMYDSTSSLTEESESDGSTLQSPTPEVVEPLIWTDKKIPLCGYRDRNQSLHISNTTPLHPKRIMAALASLSSELKQSNSAHHDHQHHSKVPTTAYYQQALVAATGLNRRSLFSGKAREMIAMGDAWA